MSPLFKKLNLGAHRSIHLLNAPASFEAELADLNGIAVQRTVGARDRVTFALAFAVTQDELDNACQRLAVSVEGDAVVWIAYPKGTSKRYKCEFNRDSDWAVLGAAGFEPVRQVAIDDDWSALRFRKVEHIDSMTRSASRTLSEAGRRKAGKK